MRHFGRLAVLLCTVALALVTAVGASAEKPIKIPTPGIDATGITGICSFSISWTFPGANKGFAIIHTKKDGSSYLWGGGNNVTRVTNESNGHFVDLNTTGPGKITFGDDGSQTIDGTGHWLVGYGPVDSPSSTLLYYSGHIVLHVSPEGSLTLVSYNGAAPKDVCAMVS